MYQQPQRRFNPSFLRPISKPKTKHGFRIGEVYETKATSVLSFEVNELGNTHLLEDAAAVLKCQPNLEDINREITKRWGANAKAVWLCDCKAWAEELYGSGEDKANKVLLPQNAMVLSDIGADGKLYVYQGSEARERVNALFSFFSIEVKTQMKIKALNQIPWFIVLAAILGLNAFMNGATAEIRLPNALTQLLLYVALGYSLVWGVKKTSWVSSRAMTVFLMTGVFVLSTLVSWFITPGAALSTSLWLLTIVQLVLWVNMFTGWKSLPSLGMGLEPSILMLLFAVVAGVWINLLHLGWSQSLLWNLSIGTLCTGTLLNRWGKSNTDDAAAVICLVAILIAAYAAFAISGLTLTLLPI